MNAVKGKSSQLTKLHEESTIGYCLKEVTEFKNDIKNQEWKCPFCKDFTLKVPRETDHASWKKCNDFIIKHIDEHRLLVLKQASLNTLKKYDKHVSESSKRTRVWIEGTMQDRS